MTNTDAAIEVQNLSYRYQEQGQKKSKKAKGPDYAVREALQGLSFRAPVGKITGLLGPNGSGKSTTFKIISTQIAAGGGDVLIFGHSVTKNPAQARALLGVTFQSPSLDAWLTVRENLQIQAALFGLSAEVSRARIEELGVSFALQEKMDVRVQTLSGGWARRVELAKSLLHGPKILLLDEPTTGLDPLAKKKFWSVLKQLRDEGVTILVTTHLMDEAELCDELVFMYEGRLAASGKPAALRAELGGDIVWIGVDDVERGLREIRARFPSAKVASEDHQLRVESGEALRVLDFARQEWGDRVNTLKWAHPSLADVYFSKTGHNFYEATSDEVSE